MELEQDGRVVFARAARLAGEEDPRLAADLLTGRMVAEDVEAWREKAERELRIRKSADDTDGADKGRGRR